MGFVRRMALLPAPCVRPARRLNIAAANKLSTRASRARATTASWGIKRSPTESAVASVSGGRHGDAAPSGLPTSGSSGARMRSAGLAGELQAERIRPGRSKACHYLHKFVVVFCCVFFPFAGALHDAASPPSRGSRSRFSAAINSKLARRAFCFSRARRSVSICHA